MMILPVIDIRAGIVVRAIAGRRAEYRPLVSRLTDSTEPLAVARAIRDRFGWTAVYLADLDAIAGADPALDLYRRFVADGFELWLDAGVRDVADAERLTAAGVGWVIVGLETVRSPAAWGEIVRRLGAERVVFSLDLRDGRPVVAAGGWSADACAIADEVIAGGGRRVIVLDVARVGGGGGPGTEALCADLVRRHPGVEVYAGGGVRGWADVRRLAAVGVAGVLVASALHDGTLKPEPS